MIRILAIAMLVGCGAKPKGRSFDELPPIYIKPAPERVFVRVKDCFFADDQPDGSKYPEMICTLLQEIE